MFVNLAVLTVADPGLCFCLLEDMRRRIAKQQPLPLLEDILQMSRGGDTYRWVCSKLLRSVVGCSTWNTRYYKETLSDVATDSDESFLLLTIENNFRRWMDEARHWAAHPGDDEENGAWRANIAEALYTNSGSSRVTGRGSCRRHLGWSRAGYLRFNELHGLVKEDRKLRANFEVDMQERFREEHANKRDAADSEDEEEEIFPANDMAGVQLPGEAMPLDEEACKDGDEDSSNDSV